VLDESRKELSHARSCATSFTQLPAGARQHGIDFNADSSESMLHHRMISCACCAKGLVHVTDNSEQLKISSRQGACETLQHPIRPAT
jgi:hypothetical protein